MYFEASLHCLKGGRSPPALCKQNVRMIGSKNTNSEASLHGLNSGGCAPPICKHNARMMGFNQNFKPEAFRQPGTA